MNEVVFNLLPVIIMGSAAVVFFFGFALFMVWDGLSELRYDAWMGAFLIFSGLLTIFMIVLFFGGWFLINGH